MQMKNQSGGVMVITVIALVLLFAFMGLAVDMTMVKISDQQGQYYASLASLRALEAFNLAKDPNSTASVQEQTQNQLNAAISSANQLLASNYIVAGRKAPNQLGTSSNAKVRLKPGRFNFGLNVDGSNPCSPNDPPCFVDWDGGSSTINAFRVQGSLYTSPLGSVAKQLLGLHNSDVSVSSTATMIPRKECFVVDLSNSMATQNFGQAPVQYSYLLAADNAGDIPPELFSASDLANWTALPADHSPPICGSEPTNEPDISKYCADVNNCADKEWAEYDTAWSAWYQTWIAWYNCQHPTSVTAKSDYELITTLSDKSWDATYEAHHPDPSSSPPGQSTLPYSNPYALKYRVHKTTAAEPFSTAVVDGLMNAMKLFQSRQVAGDAACVIFFGGYKRAIGQRDQVNLPWTTTFKLTDDFQYIIDRLNVRDSGAARMLALQQGIFPRTESYTDLLGPVQEAYRQLKVLNPSTTEATYSIHLISDAMVNCQHCATDLNDSPDVSGGCVRECNNDYNHYLRAIEELKSFAFNTLTPNQVAFHVTLVGSHVAPNTVDWHGPAPTGGGPAACYGDSELRTMQDPSRSYVRGESRYTQGCMWYNNCPTGDCWTGQYCPSYYGNFDINWVFQNASAQFPFKQVNTDTYQIAVGTGGLFLPLRPNTTTYGWSTCNAANAPACCGDDGGVRITDPLNRTPSAQMKSYMNQIIGDNPYTIVETKFNRLDNSDISGGSSSASSSDDGGGGSSSDSSQSSSSSCDPNKEDCKDESSSSSSCNPEKEECKDQSSSSSCNPEKEDCKSQSSSSSCDPKTEKC